MIVDVSHISDEGFWDIIERTKMPVIATHSNSRAICNVPRNLTDDMFRAICQTGGVAGINHFMPQEMKLRAFSPKILIDRFTVRLDNIKPVIDGEDVVLRHDENFFNIEFSALEYINNSNCEYAYMLEGFNDDWVKVSGGTATFTNVPPGIYTFRVRSTNGDKVWCDNEEVLRIYVRRPWYLTIWAFLLYALVLGASVVLFRRQIKEKERQKHLLDLEVIEKQAQREKYEAKLNFFTNIAAHL